MDEQAVRRQQSEPAEHACPTHDVTDSKGILVAAASGQQRPSRYRWVEYAVKSSTAAHPCRYSNV